MGGKFRSEHVTYILNPYSNLFRTSFFFFTVGCRLVVFIYGNCMIICWFFFCQFVRRKVFYRRDLPVIDLRDSCCTVRRKTHFSTIFKNMYLSMYNFNLFVACLIFVCKFLEVWIVFMDYVRWLRCFLLLAFTYFSFHCAARETLLVDHPWYITI